MLFFVYRIIQTVGGDVCLFIYTVYQNDTALTCYNVDEHRTILIIFGRNVAKKVKIG